MRVSVVAFAVLSLAACPTPINVGADAGPDVDGGVTSCVDDQQCGGGFCLNGLCSQAECTSKANCSATQICAQGRCVPPPATCASSEDCPGQLVCDGFSNSCFDPHNPGGEGEGEGGEGEGGEGEGEGGEGEGEGGEGEGEGGEGEGEGGEGEGEGQGGPSIDLSGFAVENRQNDPVTQAGVFPAGTVLLAGHTVVIGRSASKTEFESFWGPLPSTALYLNGNANTSGIPIVNGGEIWALVDPNGSVVDGPTITGGTGSSYQRTGAGSASSASNWATSPDTPGQATPGTTALPAGSGLRISEWSDTNGTGNFIYEFLELSYQP